MGPSIKHVCSSGEGGGGGGGGTLKAYTLYKNYQFPYTSNQLCSDPMVSFNFTPVVSKREIWVRHQFRQP